MSTAAPAPALLTKREAASYLRLSVRSLDRLPIPKIKTPGGGKCLYRRESLDRWATDNER